MFPMILILFVWCAMSETWDGMNAPTILDKILPTITFDYNLDQLPFEGTIGFKPYSDTYWPDYQRGIANRWNSPRHAGTYSLNSKTQLLRMGERELSWLSPAEKFDIFNQRYDYPTVKTEWKRTSPTTPTWMGLCDGWATSSVSYYQPEPVTMSNADGVLIPFGSADVKALLSYFLVMYAKQSPMVGIGGRCDEHLNRRTENLPQCRDVNAGAFHVLLANLIGTHQFGFTFDKDRGHEVWNHPIMAFKSVLQPNGPNSVLANTLVLYATETDPKWEAHPGKILREDYTYVLELDRQRNIIGGYHLTYDHPDSAWILPLPTFEGYFEPLEQIYQASVGFKGTRRLASPGIEINSLAFAEAFVAEGSSFGFRSGDIESAWAGWGNRGGGAGRRGGRGRGLLDTVPDEDGDYRLLNASESWSSSLHTSPSIVASWSITPGPATTRIDIEFLSFNTTSSEMLRIYENGDCSGALVAAMQGSDLPTPVMVHADSCCLLFALLHSQSAPAPTSYFEARYSAHTGPTGPAGPPRP